MRLDLPPLKSLRVFETAARLESFTRAADELSVTHGAVSRQVAQLERWMGQPLFERLHRQVRLTRAGLQLRDELTASFVRIASATERARRRTHDTRRLRVSAPPAFSVRWLIPRLASFQLQNPQIEVSLTSSVAPPDFRADEYDLAIRRFSRRPRIHHAVRMFDEFSVPVCHRDAAAGLACPITGPDLVRHCRLIRVAAEPRGWSKWAQVWKVDLGRARFVDVELTYLSVQATIEGLGVALLPITLASDDIVRGVLTMPLGPKRIDASTYFVVAAKEPGRATPARRMIDWLQAEGQLSMSQALASLDR